MGHLTVSISSLQIRELEIERFFLTLTRSRMQVLSIQDSAAELSDFKLSHGWMCSLERKPQGSVWKLRFVEEARVSGAGFGALSRLT